MRFSDYQAKLTLQDDTLTISLRFPDPETAKTFTEALLASHQRGEPVSLDLSKPATTERVQ